MANSSSSKKDTGTNDGLALIIGGLFVLALVFATYSYFNRNNTLDEDVMSDTSERNTDQNDQKTSLGERLRDLFSSDDADESETGGRGGPADTPQAEETTDEDVSVFEQWVATDYEEGDISGSSYVVKSGDTLWEIAEARYGNGAEWTQILEANSADIGYLPSGQQALIVTGQTLLLP